MGVAYFFESARFQTALSRSNRVRSIRRYRLERQGLLESEWGVSDNNRRAKYYSLTNAGRGRLRTETQSWNRLSLAIETALRAKLREA